MRTAHSNDIVILGGGIAGLTVALALAQAGHPVTLFERDDILFNRASLRNEGKVHLGLIYAAEAGRATADLQLEGALHFRRLVSEWTPGQQLSVSSRFNYLVHHDSLLSPDDLAAHYDHVETRLRDALRQDRALDYLGERPEGVWSRLSDADLARWFTPACFTGAFDTAERAIDPAELGSVLTTAILAHPLITVRTGHKVEDVQRSATGFLLEGSNAQGKWTAEAEQVVNCTWDSLYRLDRMAGLAPPDGWLMRLKYRVLTRLPDALATAPSATLVLGPFGDVVIRPDRTAYLSWYPAGLQGWSHDLDTPSDWDAPCMGQDDPDRSLRIAQEIKSRIDAWMPGIGQSTQYQIDAGAILAHGKTDVDDRSSGLHGRMDSGITSYDGWHSFNPGKLTTAPMFAQQAAQIVAGQVTP